MAQELWVGLHESEMTKAHQNVRQPDIVNPREESIGRMATFLAPSLKLKQRDEAGQSLEARIHTYLVQTFGGYTAAAGNIFGYWKDEEGKESYGEHKEYKVGLKREDRLPELKRFLADLARQMDEECIYLQTGEEASFIYGDQSRD